MVEKENKSKVFLSYAANDRKKIDFLKNGLIENGFSVLSDSLIAPGTNWHKIISYELNASDYLIICLTTKMFADGPFTFDYNKAFVSEAKKRDITIIPILLDDILMPDALKEFVYLDFRKNHSDQLKSLIEKMKAIDSISFEKLSPLVFEDLTLEILKTFNFENIQKESVKFDRGIDFMANLYEKDLFGRINKQTWLIESKFYQKERFSINILKELVDRYKYIFRDDAKLLLITNSLLTSVAREYLAEIHRSNLIDVRVIDGSELKDIITSNKSIHLKFFGNG